MTVRPTAFGAIAAGVAVAVMLARSGINDPALSALVWVAFVALIVLGAAVPVLALLTASVEASSERTDLVVGHPSPIAVTVRGTRLVDSVRCSIDGADLAADARSDMPGGVSTPTGVWSIEIGRPGRIDVAWSTRGVRRRLDVVLATDGPLGIVAVTRRVSIELAHPVAVGPVAIHGRFAIPTAAESGTDERAADIVGGGDQVRSVRPYRSGDPAHLVHWPSSARIGSLVVRELEPPARPSVVIVVDLGPVGAERSIAELAVAERTVAEAAGRALEVMRVGGEVMLCTNDEGTPTAALVTDARQLNRRLAGAVAGPTGEAPGLAAGPGAGARP